MDGLPASSTASDTPESTATLLERARAGDQAAVEALFARCAPPLRQIRVQISKP